MKTEDLKILKKHLSDLYKENNYIVYNALYNIILNYEEISDLRKKYKI